MSLAQGWMLAPLVLLLSIAGCGLLAERLSGHRLPGAMVPPVGLAVLIAVTGLFALLDATAELAVPAAVIAAAAGFALTEPWKDPRLRAGLWPLLLAAAAYLVYAAPSLLTGQGSITGYVKLDDSATWLALTDHVFEFGREISDVPAGSYARTLDAWLGGEYPVGAFLPLGVGARVAGADPAAAYQATIAVFAAILALGLYQCARWAVASRGLAAACAFGAVQASLLFGYANWGGVKEICAAALLPPLAWLAWRGEVRLLAVVAGAVFGVLGVNGVVWAGPALLIGAWRCRERRRLIVAGGVLLVATLPAIVTLNFLWHTTQGAISAGEDIGNLARPLPILQGFGLWPTGDLRAQPDPRWIAVVLALACAGLAYAAVAAAVKRREWGLPILLGIVLAGVLPAVAIGSPWVDAKALAVLAPFVLLAALTFVAGRPFPFAAAGAVVLGGAILWSTQLVIRDVFVAPRERLAELKRMSERAGITGPLVVLDFEIYANRHFLREYGTDGATDLRERPVAKADGSTFPTLSAAEVDLIAPQELWAFRGIVRRRNPVASRPPSAFARVEAGPNWERWERAPSAPVPARLPLNTGLDPTGAVDCAALANLAKNARELAYVEREPPVLVDLVTGAVPPPWTSGGRVVPVVDGSASIPVTLPSAGRWRVYVGGSTLGRLEVRVDGEPVGDKRHELAHDGQWLRFDARDLPAGEHTVELIYSAGPPQAGIGEPSPLGPLALVPETTEGDLPVGRIPPRRYRELCDGRRLDWVEALQ